MSTKRNREEFIDFINMFYDPAEEKKVSVTKIIELGKEKKGEFNSPNSISSKLKFRVGYFSICFLIILISIFLTTINIKNNIVNNEYNSFVSESFLEVPNYNYVSIIDRIINTNNSTEKYFFFETEFLNKSQEYFVCIDKKLYDKVLSIYYKIIDNNQNIIGLPIRFNRSFDVIDGKIIYLLDKFKEELGIENIVDVIKTFSNNNGTVNYNQMVCIYSFEVFKYRVTENMETGEKLNVNKEVIYDNVLYTKNSLIIEPSIIPSNVERKYESIKKLSEYNSLTCDTQLMIFTNKNLYNKLTYVNPDGNYDIFFIASFKILKFFDNHGVLSLKSIYSIKDQEYNNLLFSSNYSIFGQIKLPMKECFIKEEQFNGYYEAYFDLDTFLKLCGRSFKLIGE